MNILIPVLIATVFCIITFIITRLLILKSLAKQMNSLQITLALEQQRILTKVSTLETAIEFVKSGSSNGGGKDINPADIKKLYDEIDAIKISLNNVLYI